MWGKIFGSFGNNHSEYTSKKGHARHSTSRDKLDKYPVLWVSKAKSPAEKYSLSLVHKIFWNVLKSSESDEILASDLELQNHCKSVFKEGLGYGYNIDLQRRSLNFFPEIPEPHFRIHSMDLSNNYLKELPGGSARLNVFHLNMSGNKLKGCLDSIDIDVQFLEMKNCNITELTENLFSQLECMAYMHEECNPASPIKKSLLYKLDLTGNPLSNCSFERIKSYRERFKYPIILCDETNALGLRSHDNIKDLNRSYRVEENPMKENNEILNKVSPAIGHQRNWHYYTSYFTILNVEKIPEKYHHLITGFLEECLPLSRLDPFFKNYVSDTINNALDDKLVAGYFFNNLAAKDRVTFNNIKECWLAWNMINGKYDSDPKALTDSLRNLFLSQEIEKYSSGNASIFVQFEALLKEKFEMNIEKKCKKSFIKPSRNDLLKIAKFVSDAKDFKLQAFLNNHPIWKEFWYRYTKKSESSKHKLIDF